jgi:COPII coat assembly protein SEC16
MTRPSLDKIGNWLEGRLTKFIAGEGDNAADPEEHQTRSQQLQGPFSHYSSISSAIHSTDPSPRASTTNLASMAGSQPPPARSGSAMAMRSSACSPHLPVNRSSSAMDYVRPHDRRSPVHRITSAHTPGAGFAQQKSAYSYSNGYDSHYYEGSGLTTAENSPTTLANGIGKHEESDQEGGPWWSSDHKDNSDSRTSTSAFMYPLVNGTDSQPPSGFISLMDGAPTVQAPYSSHSNNPPPLKEEDEDEEDLGIGNTPRRSQQPTPNNGKGSTPPDKQEVSRASSEDTTKPGMMPLCSAKVSY